MSLLVRDSRPEDLDQLANVWSNTFNRGQPYLDEPLIEEWERAYVAELDGRIVGAFSNYQMRTQCRGAELPNAGIAAVGVLPEHRHKGIGRDMMRWSLPALKEQGFALASLYAFRESYYRNFGYEVAGRRWEIFCPNS